jgi:peroxiredoxin|tara:strand:- start:63968 stop:64594 length:627 start_codon:yes stop_codon:yes gene_type:complete
VVSKTRDIRRLISDDMKANAVIFQREPDCMYTRKLHPGSEFPAIQVKRSDGEALTLGKPQGEHDWQLVVVYRGKHCPICTKFLNKLESYRERFSAQGVDLVAVSADDEQQLTQHRESLEVNFPLAYGLTLEQMQSLGLFISTPRSEKETDHDFPEPAFFIVNGEGKIQIQEIANAPFVRPDLDTLVGGIEFIRKPDNDYPIRGTRDYD